MKIIEIIPNLNTGGAEKFCVELSNELSKSNEVILCSLFDVKKKMLFVKKIDKKVTLVTLNKKSGLDLKIFFKIYKLIKKEKPQIVHTHLKGLFYSIMSVFLFKKISFFHTVHNIAEKETSIFFRKIYFILFNYFNVKPISISRVVLKSTKKLYGAKHKLLVYNGIKKQKITTKFNYVKKKINSYKKNKNTLVFSNIGRISPQKNQLMLIDIFNKFIDRGKNIILLIIGEDSSKEKKYLHQINSLKKNNIFLLGIKENITDYLRLSDALCLSSAYEGLPLTLLEAMSVGCIPICTPVGGIPDVISNKNAFLSNNASKKFYENTLNKFFKSHKNNKLYMKKKLIQKFNTNFNIERTSREYNELFKL